MQHPKPQVLVILSEGTELPFYATEGAAGADVMAYLETPLEILPGACRAVPTGLRLQIPEGYEVQVRPRSGLASKGLIVPNAPGTIDCDYRGEVKVLLMNLGQEVFIVQPGMRIAQLVVAKVEQAAWVEAEALVATARGEGGFGHTGV